MTKRRLRKIKDTFRSVLKREPTKREYRTAKRNAARRLTYLRGVPLVAIPGPKSFQSKSELRRRELAPTRIL